MTSKHTLHSPWLAEAGALPGQFSEDMPKTFASSSLRELTVCSESWLFLLCSQSPALWEPVHSREKATARRFLITMVVFSSWSLFSYLLNEDGDPHQTYLLGHSEKWESHNILRLMLDRAEDIGFGKTGVRSKLSYSLHNPSSTSVSEC